MGAPRALNRVWANPVSRALLNAALAVAAALVLVQGLTEGGDYLGDGRWGYGAFVFGPFIVLVCGYIALEAVREVVNGQEPQPPPLVLWAMVVLAYVALGAALLAT